MAAAPPSSGRTRFAVLGVLGFGPATGYEIRGILSRTTAHFWRESYGQIYPTLETLQTEGCIELLRHEREGRESKRYRLLPAGREALEAWIREPGLQLRPGRNELLLKLFFARRPDAPWLIPQVENYARTIRELRRSYTDESTETGGRGAEPEVPPEARPLVDATLDFGLSAAEMQLSWCERTLAVLRSLG